MIITTSRKPTSKTRIFCKRLSRFTGKEYLTRGKTSLSMLAETSFLVVGESNGNPANFNFFLNKECVLSIRANVSLDREIGLPGEPVIEGDTPLAFALSKAMGLRMGDSGEKVIHVNDRIEFIDKGIPYIILKVLEARGEGIV